MSERSHLESDKRYEKWWGTGNGGRATGQERSSSRRGWVDLVRGNVDGEGCGKKKDVYLEKLIIG